MERLGIRSEKQAVWLFFGLTAVLAVLSVVTAGANEVLSADYPLQPVLLGLGTAALLSGLSMHVLRCLQSDCGAASSRFHDPLLAAGLTLAITLVSYFFAGMWPFGENTCVYSDMYSQYMPLLAHYRGALLGDGSSLAYCAQMGLGMRMVPTIGYYLASPLNLLALLFPQDYLAECFLVIITIKTVISAFTFTLCAQYLHGRRWHISVITGVLFATSMFFVAYSWNLMWFDAIMVLPLAVLGLERLLRSGRPLAYIVSLGYALCFNFYAGYMLCLFLVLYFVVFCVRERCAGRALGGRLVRFAVCSVLGGCLAGVLILPTYLGLQLTSAAGETLPEFGSNFALVEFFARHFFGVAPTELQTADLPNIACGVLPMLAVPLYGASSSIPLRRRAAYLGLWAVLAASMALNVPNLIWHGLHAPNGLPYRYAFLYVFVVLLMTNAFLSRLHRLKLRSLCAAGICVAVYILVMERVSEEELVPASIYVTLLLVLVYCGILLFAAKKRLRCGAVCAVLLFAVCAESLFSANDARAQMGLRVHHSGYLLSEEHKLLETMSQEATSLAQGQTFYRVDNSDRFTRMDSALYGNSGVSIFSSTYYYTTTKLMQHLGMACNNVNSHSMLGYLPTLHSLLGVQYYISSFDLTDEPGLEKVKTMTSGALSWDLYRNKDALDLGVVGKASLQYWTAPVGNPVAAQNSLYTALSGDSRRVLRSNTVVSKMKEVQTSTSGDSVQISTSGAVTGAEVTISVTEPGPTYVYVDCRKAEKIEVVGAGSQLENMKQPTFLNTGRKAVGDTITIRLDTNEAVSGAIYAATLDEAVYESDIAVMQENSFTAETYEDTHIAGSVTAQEDGVLLLTMSYDAGWRAWIDGEAVEPFAIDGGLLGLRVPSGTHTLELRFRTPGLTLGLFLTVGGIAGTMLLILAQRRWGFWMTGRAPARRRRKTKRKGADEDEMDDRI